MAITGGIAAIGALASAGTAAYSAYNQSGIQGHQQQMGDTVFGEQQNYAQQLQALIANPSSVTSLPGYAFNLDQGSQTVARQMASSGFSGSGNEAAALTQYGQGYAMNTFNQYAGLLGSLAGLSSPVNPTQALNGASSANNSAFNQWGGALASLGYMSGQNYNWGGGSGVGYGNGVGGGLGIGSGGWNPNAGGLTYDTGFAGSLA